MIMKLLRWLFGAPSTRAATNPSDDDALEKLEARARLDKLMLEKQKLLLEYQALKRQASWRGVAIEWLKAMAVPVTLVGATVAYFVGVGQLRQAEENRDSDRFEKAVSRLVSDKADDRITGVSGLRLFVLERRIGQYRSATVQYLINALSLEKDARVQGAILETLSSLEHADIPQRVLDDALKTIVERNRRLTKEITAAWRPTIEAAEKQQVAKALRLNVDSIGTPIPQEVISKLSLSQFFEVVRAEHGTFSNLSGELSVPLEGMAKAIEVLIRLGAKHSDYSEIYCPKCDFSPSKTLAEANFEDSYLRGANFSHVDLRHASFHEAEIGGASFYASNLSGADLGETELNIGSSKRNSAISRVRRPSRRTSRWRDHRRHLALFQHRPGSRIRGRGHGASCCIGSR